MPRQGEDHLLRNISAVKAILENAIPERVAGFVRHGNARREASWLAAVALTCWGWASGRTLGDRVSTACRVVGCCFDRDETITRQGLLNALGSCGGELVTLMIDALTSHVQALRGYWTRQGKVNVAVDGSKFAAPRTEANQAFFAASGRKAADKADPSTPAARTKTSKAGSKTKLKTQPTDKRTARRKANGKKKTTARTKRNTKAARPKGDGSYEKPSDEKKASTVQILLTIVWHLSSGLPLQWMTSGSGGSERKNAALMLETLPRNARLIGDAAYVGYPFWSKIHESGRTFLVRVGSNLTLLDELGEYRLADGIVSYWPDGVMRANQPPLALRLFRIRDGRDAMYLVTNELDMDEAAASGLYAERWGVEVFFRTVKQTCERAKLCCLTPENVLTELNWSLLGIWYALFTGKQVLLKEAKPPHALSGAKTMTAFARVVTRIYEAATPVQLLERELANALLQDESRRTTSKQSRNYPRRKKRRRCGAPNIRPATKEQQHRYQQLIL